MCGIGRKKAAQNYAYIFAQCLLYLIHVRAGPPKARKFAERVALAVRVQNACSRSKRANEAEISSKTEATREHPHVSSLSELGGQSMDSFQGCIHHSPYKPVYAE